MGSPRQTISPHPVQRSGMVEMQDKLEVSPRHNVQLNMKSSLEVASDT